MGLVRTTLSALVAILMSGGPAWSGEAAGSEFPPMLLAGEILIGPDRNEIRAPGGSTQRDRAAAYQREKEELLPEEDGFLSPRSGAPAEERAFDNRTRARIYQQGVDPSAVIPGAQSGQGGLPLPATSQERARDLRTRARSFNGNSNAQEIDLSNVGTDGIPVVSCRGDVDNVAARIGEDGISGSVFYIMRNGKPVKVRCK